MSYPPAAGNSPSANRDVPDQVRREPPHFRLVEVSRSTDISLRLRRLTLSGPDLAGLPEALPAASVRLLLAKPGISGFELPTWNGNEFLNSDGTRPVIRTLTPRRYDPDRMELDVEVVLHGATALTSWAVETAPSTPVGLSGPGRGYAFDRLATSFVLAGDESALPAIAQLLEVLPATAQIAVMIEIAEPEARFDLPEHPSATIDWIDLPTGSQPGAALTKAIIDHDMDCSTQFWAAGEAASMQRVRRHIFDERGLTRAQTVIRGYWKHGRSQLA